MENWTSSHNKDVPYLAEYNALFFLVSNTSRSMLHIFFANFHIATKTILIKGL